MSEAHDVFTEQPNKITLSANDDKRIQKPDGVTTHLDVNAKSMGCTKENKLI